MLFGKKKGAAGSRRTASQQADKETPTSNAANASEPAPQPEEDNVASAQDDISQVAGDPIQQLFTTLGKFHRHLNKAQHAPDGEGWCDACMHELMTGLEISIACNWTPVKDALIDAARILHSYEQAGKAGLCVPFLRDSYELLSLMVGDLIVDTVRTGVKQKWREHYMRAVEELESLQIPLVEDDEREVNVTHQDTATDVDSIIDEVKKSEPPEKAAATSKATPPETADTAAAEETDATASIESAGDMETQEEVESEAPAVSTDARDDTKSDDVPPLSDDITAARDAADKTGAGEDDASTQANTEEETPFEEPSLSDTADVPFPPTDAETDTPPQDTSATEATGDTPFPPVHAEEETPFQDSLDSDGAALEEEVARDLAAAFSDDKREPESPETTTTDDTASSDADAVSDETIEDGSVGDTDTSEAATQQEPEDEAPAPASDDTASPDSETADTPTEKELFDSHDASSDDATPEEEISTDAEHDATQAPPEETPATSSTESVEDTSPEALLQRVQAAISTGDTGNTKAMALELAVAMARLEYEQARENLAKTEQLLLENGNTIKQAKTNVEKAEHELLQAEELLAAREGERNACREQVGTIDDELDTLKTELADIDAQIEALQQKRREQANRIENKQAEHAEAIDSESRTQTELESLTQEMESIHERLGEAQEEVKQHNAKRRAIETDIIRAREAVEARRLSLAAIEHTRQPEETAPRTEEDTDSLL